MTKRIFNLANNLTLIRIVIVPILIVIFLYSTSKTSSLIAATLFALAAFTDWLDGYLARRFDNETVLGKLMDPLADKILVTAALIMLIPLGRIPAWVCLLIISREIVITGIRGLAATIGKVVAADYVGKVKSNFQYFGIGFLIFPLNLIPIPYQYELGITLVYVSLVLSLWSAAQYVYNLREIFVETS